SRTARSAVRGFRSPRTARARRDTRSPARADYRDDRSSARLNLGARAEHDAIADELRHQPFFVVLRRQARVHHAQIRLSVAQRVREEEALAFGAVVAEAKARKGRLAALVVVVQVDEERDDALAALRDLFGVIRDARI